MQPSAIVEARATEVNLGMHSKDKDKDKDKDSTNYNLQASAIVEARAIGFEVNFDELQSAPYS